jgi:predicted ester cyclase
MATMTHTDLRTVVERYFASQRRRDPAGLAQFHGVDGTAESPMYGTLVGRPAIEEAYRAFYTSFPDATSEIESMVIDPPHVATFSTIMATHMNEFFGLPGTKRRIDFRIARLLEMEGDLIKHERRIYDFTGILVQVGVLRAKPAKP